MKFKHTLAMLLAAVLFAALYLSTAYLLPQSFVSAHAGLRIPSPFVFRLLIPWTLGQFMPPAMLDGDLIKIVFAAGSAFAALALMPAFARRVNGQALQGRALWGLGAAMWLMLSCHYWVPRPYMFYYIYDLPAIPLYMACFLGLTRSSERISWPTMGLVLLAFLNRETVVIALFHAVAHHLAILRGSLKERLWQMSGFLWRAALLVALMALIRLALMQWIQPEGDGNAAFMEGPNIRVLANLYRIRHIRFFTWGVGLFGFGALFWLPLGYARLPHGVKALLWGSALPMLLLMLAGNMVELRIYGELVPLLSLAFFTLLRRRPANALAAP
jgi:hypothetical protein